MTNNKNKIESLKKLFEKKYPEHNFDWKIISNGFIGLCPEHEDRNPSFNVFEYNGKSYYKCFSCGFKGSLYDFTVSELTPEQKETYENNKKIQLTLSDAFKEMKDYLFNGETVESVFARKYLNETRLLDLNAIKHCDVGIIETNHNYDEIDALLEPLSNGKPNKLEYYKGYLVFAHTDIEGNICLLRFRSPDGNKDIKTAKIKRFDKYSFAFNLQLIGKADTAKHPITPHIYITEGEFNSLTYISSTGNYNICSAGPKDNVKKELIEQVLQISFKPVITLDQDLAGINRLKKLYSEIKKNQHKNIIYCEYGELGNKNKKDFDDMLKNKSDEGINLELQNIKYKTLNKLEEEIFKDEAAKKEEIVKNIDKFIINESLKEVYLEQYDIKSQNKIKVVNINDVLTDESEEIFNGIFPVGISTIAGYPSAGKTYSAIYIAMLYAIKNLDKRVFCWLSEDSMQQVKKRITYLNNRYKFEKINNLDLCFDIALPIMKNEYSRYSKSKYADEIKNILQNYSLVFLDPLVDFSAGIDENGNGDIADFMLMFKEIARGTNTSIVFLHHVNKSSINNLSADSIKNNKLTIKEISDRLTKVRGASAIAGASRMVLYCETNPLADDKRVISIIKNNNGQNGKIEFMVQLPSIPTNVNEAEQKNIKVERHNSNFKFNKKPEKLNI